MSVKDLIKRTIILISRFGWIRKIAKIIFWAFPGFRDRMNRIAASANDHDPWGDLKTICSDDIQNLKAEILNTKQEPYGDKEKKIRIVIGLHGIQSGNSGVFSLESVKVFLSKKPDDFEVYLVLNGKFQTSVQKLIKEMSPYIERDHIKTFLFDLNAVPWKARGSVKIKIENILREWFLHQFEADIIWDPNGNDAYSCRKYTSGDELYCISLPDADKVKSSFANWADLILVPDEQVRAKVQKRSGSARKNVFVCDDSAEKIWTLFREKAEKRQRNPWIHYGNAQLLADIKRLYSPSALPVKFSVLKMISENLLFTTRRKLYVDLSETISQPFCTGIQRVANTLAQRFDSMNAADFECVPCYSRPEINAIFPAQWDGRKFQALQTETPSQIIHFRDRDILLIADIQYANQHAKQEFYAQLTSRGVLVVNIIFDLLPIDHPECFPPGGKTLFRSWLDTTCLGSGAVGISKYTIKRYCEWLSETKNGIVNPYFKTSFFHLGADFSQSKYCVDSAFEADADLIALLRKSPAFLVVSTLEPRKCHEQILDAFTQLWQNGVDADLVFVGRNGWSNDHIKNKIESHPLLGKRLFWLQDVSDTFLEAIYSASACVIFASVDEGFGLAIIEGAYYHKHLLLRDIEVFREIAGDHASYFSGFSADDLAKAVSKWLDAYRHTPETLPDSSNIRILSWQESAECLLTELRKF